MNKKTGNERKIIVIEDAGVPKYFFLAKKPNEIKLRVLRTPEVIPLGVTRELTAKEKQEYLSKIKTKRKKQ